MGRLTRPREAVEEASVRAEREAWQSDVEAPAPAFTGSCGHLLQRHVTSADGYCCNRCGIGFSERTTLLGCSQCDFDLCADCCRLSWAVDLDAFEMNTERYLALTDEAVDPSVASNIAAVGDGVAGAPVFNGAAASSAN